MHLLGFQYCIVYEPCNCVIFSIINLKYLSLRHSLRSVLACQEKPRSIQAVLEDMTKPASTSMNCRLDKYLEYRLCRVKDSPRHATVESKLCSRPSTMVKSNAEN